MKSLHPRPATAPEAKLQDYFLPNLLTAGKPLLRFRGVDQDREADLTNGDFQPIRVVPRIYSAGLHF